MASEMDWAYTTCLSCDNQIFEGEFCSQACRLADLEKGSPSEPASPTTSTYSSKGFHLPPAVNFAAYRTSSLAGSTPSSPQQTSYFAASQSSTPSTSPSGSGLSPSSSRSSLASMAGLQSSSQGLSPQAASYLRGYLSSFDQVRDLKRRATNP